MTFRFKCQCFWYSANASLYGCTIVKFKAFTVKAEQRSNNADKGFDAILIILRFQKILKAAKSCLKIAEVTTSISKGAFLCKVTKTRNMKLNMLFAVQTDSVINSNVDFTADTR